MRQKKVQTLEEYLKQELPINKKSLYADKYKNSIDKAYNDSELELVDKYDLSIGKYSLRTRVKNNPWLKSGRPASEAIKWFYREVLHNPGIYRYNKRLLYSGGMFTFEYFNPKYKDTKQLPWFDKYPLVISLGPVVTKQGVRNLGLNLHILPPKVRIVVMCQIFELYKKLYRYQIFFNREKPVQIKYQMILKALRKYGVDFCVRMYIPARQKTIVMFPYKEWYKAIFMPSRAYDGIKANKLQQEWVRHVRKLGYSTQANINWETTI